MLSIDFTTIFKTFPNINSLFDGVFAINTIPKKLMKVHHFIICNTDVDTGSGQHWFCILRTDKNTLECFDSLGIDEDKKVFLSTFYKQSRVVKEIKINIDRVQSLRSETCGEFVVLFIFERLHNRDLSFSDLLNECFTPNINSNESKVTNFFKEMFQNV